MFHQHIYLYNEIMARKPRIIYPGAIYHIIIRGINKQSIFEEDSDYFFFLKILDKYLKEAGILIYAYVLMDNHVHMLLADKEAKLSEFMKKLGVMYCGYFNNKYERSGGLFEGRFKSEIVNDAPYLLSVIRYIHQNPLKAGIVKKVSDYRWSSYQEYLKEENLIDGRFILEMFDGDLKKFIAFNNEPNTSFTSLIDDKRHKMSDGELRILIKRETGLNAINFTELSENEKAKVLRLFGKSRTPHAQQLRILKISRSSLYRFIKNMNK